MLFDCTNYRFFQSIFQNVYCLTDKNFFCNSIDNAHCFYQLLGQMNFSFQKIQQALIRRHLEGDCKVLDKEIKSKTPRGNKNHLVSII
jgi:hypothetical protein